MKKQPNLPQKLVFKSLRLEQQWIRTESVRMAESFTVETVAKHFGVTTRAVYQWIAIYAEFGLKGLLAKEGAGRPPKLNATQMQWIATTVRDNTPNQLRFEFGLWTLRLIKELIERQFDMTLSKPTLIKVMAKLGFTPQRPLRRAYEQDAVLVQRWLSEELPGLRERAKRLGASIMYADEASMRTDHHAGTTWAPKGNTPIVKTSGKRGKSVKMISAISSTGQLEFMIVDERTTGEVFKTFLKQLMIGAKAPIILVVDGSSVHKAEVVAEYVKSTNGMLELYFLPPYSPQLNPDEQVWKNVKADVSKRCPQNASHMRMLVIQALTWLQNMPEIVRGFFAHPECGFV
jgi:transposase